MNNILQVLLTPQVLMLAAGIVAILWAIGQIPIGKGSKLARHWLWRNLLPLLPVVLGTCGALLPGVACGESACTTGTKVLAGVWSGFIAAHGHKTFTRIAIDKLRAEADK